MRRAKEHRGRAIRLRKVGRDDCRLLWEWANDPEVREASFSSNPISWEEHIEWFERKLRDPDCHLLIALDDTDGSLGQIRFDVIRENEAEIGLSIDKSKRGLGYGSALIDLAVIEVFRATPLEAVHALIKLDNAGSIRAFEHAKFKRLGMEAVRGTEALHYVRLKSDESMD